MRVQEIVDASIFDRHFVKPLSESADILCCLCTCTADEFGTHEKARAFPSERPTRDLHEIAL
jgi:hypothetical protein